MKQLTICLLAMFFTQVLMAQVSGNINYQNQTRYPDSNINISYPSNADLYISVKGMANVKADTYVAIFNLTQVGKTTEEVNSLIDGRIDQALNGIRSKNGVETYVDMISFVPIYEYEVEKKIFSKKTYNEVPAGFELKKNIHIKYTDPNLLNEIIALLASAEIYDLVRVDYFSDEIETVKKDLMTKAKTILEGKIANYETLLSTKLDTIEKHLTDAYKVVLPVEMYQSYQAYSSSSLNLKKRANVQQAAKSTTLYYQPIMDKEFDFVVNPTIIEPVIQVLYEVKVKVNREKQQLQQQQKDTNYIFITPSGDLKELNLK